MNSIPAVDKEGYLRELNDWNEEVATYLAHQEEIKLGPSHWEIIKLLRRPHMPPGTIYPKHHRLHQATIGQIH